MSTDREEFEALFPHGGRFEWSEEWGSYWADRSADDVAAQVYTYVLQGWTAARAHARGETVGSDEFLPVPPAPPQPYRRVVPVPEGGWPADAILDDPFGRNLELDE